MFLSGSEQVVAVHPIPSHVQEEYERLQFKTKEAKSSWKSALDDEQDFIKRNTPAGAEYSALNQIADGYYLVYD